jgi:methionyl-tRNA formyltransferase
MSSRLAQAGADLLIETLAPYLQGELSPQTQSKDGATYAPMLKKEDGQIDFTRSAEDLVNQVRAYNSWPGTFIPWQAGRLKIHRVHSQMVQNTTPGAHRVVDGFPAIEVQDGLLILDEVQPAGKKTMPGDVFLRGVKDW